MTNALAVLLSEVILSRACSTPLPEGEQQLEKTQKRAAGFIKPSQQQFSQQPQRWV